MFSWSKKKETKRRGNRDADENEFGVKIDRGENDKQLEAELKRLAGVDSFPEDELNLNEGEEDEEAELLRLIGGGGGRGKRPPKKPTSPDEPIGDISDLTAEIDLGDEDVEVDENDPDLLGELLELTNPEDAGFEEEEPESEPESEAAPSSGESDILGTLKERLKMYKTAEAKAKENNESSRARRFTRGIKTIEDLLKKAKAGKPVSPGDIPPVIALNLKPAPPPSTIPDGGNEGGTEDSGLENSSTESQPNPTTSSEPEDVLKTLMERLKMYQTAESKAKETGETSRARRFNRGIKTLEGLIKQAKAGKPVAPDEIPPAVALNLKPAPPVPVEPSPPDNQEEAKVEDETENTYLSSPAEEEPEKPNEPERNILDVLTERLKMYKTAEAKAKENGETSRARRFGRGIKTLQDLIKQASAGKAIASDDIPPEIALNLKPAPPIVASDEPTDVGIVRENLVQSSDSNIKPLSFAAVDDVDLDNELGDEELEDSPTTVLEGLEQRVRLYTKFHDRAKQAGDMALAERNERIVKVYLNAIKTFQRGGYVDVERLPNPNHCPPIPIPFYAD